MGKLSDIKIIVFFTMNVFYAKIELDNWVVVQ